MMKKIFKTILFLIIFLIIAFLIYGTIKQSRYDSMVEKEFHPEGRFSDIGMNKVHYQYLDSGEITFVLISGLGESMHTWSSIANDLNERGRVLRYDRSGLGFSEEGILPRSVDNVSKELNAIIDNENIPGPYIFIGHSAGGFIARYYAKKYPENIKGIFLIDSYQGDVGYENGVPEEWPLNFKIMNWIFRKMAWSGIPPLLLPDPPHPTYITSKAIRTYALETYSEKTSIKQFQKYESEGNDIPLYYLTANNKKDPFNEFNNDLHKKVFNKYSNEINKLIEIESGHHIHIEKPELVLEALDEFMGKINPIEN